MRILAIDVGSKRTGLAVTDVLQITVTPLETVLTHTLMAWLETHLAKGETDAIVIGLPVTEAGEPSAMHPRAMGLAKALAKRYPTVSVYQEDERYTSRLAEQIIRDSGRSRKARQEKGLTDKVAAALLLQSFMERRLGPKPPQALPST